jgi:hypothetical protein
VVVGMTITINGTSAVKRSRRTNTEIATLDQAIFDFARRENPISVRGIFYRVESVGIVEKSDNGYRAVQRRTLILRRTGQLPYGWITDGSRLWLKPDSFADGAAALHNTALMYRRALWIDEPVHVEIWTEKDAIRGVLYPVTSEYDVPLMISRGFSSETFLHETAEVINGDGKRAVIYQLGDHDPSGVAAWEHVQRQLRQFVSNGIELTFERLAVTPEQIEQFGLHTRPTKQSDSRAHNFVGESVEVDAIAPTILRGIVRAAIEQWIDPEKLRINEIAERHEKEILRRIAGRWDDEHLNFAEGHVQ